MDLSNWVARWADFIPAKAAIRFAGEDISYRELDHRVGLVAGMLAGALGVRHGDRIAYLGYNSPEFLVLFFACARLGAIMVPLNWRLAPPEHQYILRHAGVSALFLEPDFAAEMGALRDENEDCRLIGIGSVPDGWQTFDDLISEGREKPDGGGTLTDPVLIVYTSGTTGRPKGAVLTQSAIAFNAANSIAAHDMTSTDVVLTCLPMFHVGGLNIQTTPALQAGATVILHPRFDPAAVAQSIRDDRPSLLVLVPATMQAVMAVPGWEALDLSCLRCLDTGSTTVPPSLLHRWLDRGVPVIQVYGATETAPIAIHQRIPDAWRNAGSAGRPALYCDVRILDGEGREVPPGDVGEIAIRGPSIFSEYWNDPEATTAARKDGWFHTGDAGHVDADGNYHVDDRIKDVIISGSENIYPAELERVLDACPDIAEAAVVGRSDEKWGEVAVAVVVRAPGSAIDAASVLALFENQLARFKHPRDVTFVDALPRNVMGKVLKYELRNLISS